MKKIVLILLVSIAFSCSKEDSCDKEVTGTEAVKVVKPNVETYYQYYITFNQNDRVETNQATVDFYKGKGIVCFEGYK